MGKKKRTNNKQNTSSNTLKSIDEKVLAREIVKAHEEYEHYRQTEKEKEEKRQQEEWLKTLNQKEYPPNEKWIWRKCHQIRNDFFLFKNLLFIKAINSQTAYKATLETRQTMIFLISLSFIPMNTVMANPISIKIILSD